eukprot:135312-Prymnesium_polylepis.1
MPVPSDIKVLSIYSDLPWGLARAGRPPLAAISDQKGRALGKTTFLGWLRDSATAAVPATTAHRRESSYGTACISPILLYTYYTQETWSSR